MDQSVIEATQESLGALIKKPPLTDKLLSKPPFRFLHDIVTEVIRKHKFMVGLYSPAELQSTNVKEKEAKIAFLQKAVDVVAFVTGNPPACKPSKVVAGHEPEKTNVWLQQMASAVIAKKDSSEAVEIVLSGQKPGSKPSQPAPAAEPEAPAPTGEEKRKERKPRGKPSSTSGGAEGGVEPKGKPPLGASEGEPKERRHQDREGKKDDEHRKEKKERSEKRSKDGSRPSRRKDERESNLAQAASGEQPVAALNGNSAAQPVTGAVARPSSAKGGRHRQAAADSDAETTAETAGNVEGTSTGQRPLQSTQDDTMPNGGMPAIVEAKGVGQTETDEEDKPVEVSAPLDDTHLKPPLAPGSANRTSRPSTARPAPPKLKSRQSSAASEDGGSSRGDSSRPVAPVIVDDKQADDEDDMFVMEQAVRPLDQNETSTVTNVQDPSEHGALVTKILSTQKKLEGSSTEKDVSAERTVIVDAQRQKERERTRKEVEKLRDSVQTLCRSANPLAKMIDYVQEDMDSMQKELELWRKANHKHAEALQREEELTKEELQPLYRQLEELEIEIADQVELIGLMKANVFKNDEHIEQLVSSITFASKQ